MFTLDSALKKILSVGNKEQNQHYPPRILSEHFNIATNFVLDAGVAHFAETRMILDCIRPFLQIKEVPVINGKVKFPDDYRNFLGAGIYTVDGGGDQKTAKDCGGCEEDGGGRIFFNDPLARTPRQLQNDIVKVKCRSIDVTEVDIDEWGTRTTRKRKAPTLDKPIFCQFESSYIKVCPFGISHVEIRYIRRPKVYKFGYTMNRDDTYTFDPLTSEESEWDDTATQPMIKCLNTLYSMYVRDGEMKEWNLEIKKEGLF